MQLIIRSSGLFAVEVGQQETVQALKLRLAERTGWPAPAQTLICNGKQLSVDSSLGKLGLYDGAVVHLFGRLRGGAPAVTLTVKPRVQKDKWSLYWKESMETKTEVLDDVKLSLPPTATVAELQAALKKMLGWPNTDAAERLEGFKDPWETAIHRGRVMNAGGSLESHGIKGTATVICVRRVLVPEAWKIIEDGQDEEDLSSDEDW